MSSSDDVLPAGRVGRPHGLDGSFHVTKPRARLLAEGIPLRIRGEVVEVVRRAGTDDRPILKLAGVTSREKLEALRGVQLEVLRSDAPALEDGEWWAEDFPGLVVVDGETLIGEVVELMALPANEVLRVSREGRSELLVPLIDDAVRTVDMAARRVDVDLSFLGEEA